MRVVNNNVLLQRYGLQSFKGLRSVSVRMQGLRNLFGGYDLGIFQECDAAQADLLAKNDYKVINSGINSILWNPKTLTLRSIDVDQLYARDDRRVIFATFYEGFMAICTHLSVKNSVGSESAAVAARKRQAQAIALKIQDVKFPVVLGADLNSSPARTKGFPRTIIRDTGKLTPLREAAKVANSEFNSSHKMKLHPDKKGVWIDDLMSKGFSVLDASLVQTYPYSDHNALTGTLQNADLIPFDVSRGVNGHIVKYAQEVLNILGANLDVDGAFGPKTEKAVKSFQGKQNIEVSGIIEKQTWKVLKALTVAK